MEYKRMPIYERKIELHLEYYSPLTLMHFLLTLISMREFGGGKVIVFSKLFLSLL